jgi:CubicO group peptidase (beta-lactamase class C family)
MGRVASLPFVAHPGEVWVYGYNTDVLGCVVEKASDMPLDRFIESKITEPLGMKDTHFFLPPAARDRLAAVYMGDPELRVIRAPEGAKGQGAYVDGPRRSFSGGAGLVSTVRDYARFLEMIRNHGELGGRQYLAPRTVKLMTTNQVGTLYPTPGLGFGLGFETTDRFGANGMDSEGAFGFGGAYGTVYRVDPAARLVILMMINQRPWAAVDSIYRTFPTMVYQALLEEPPTRTKASAR